MTMGQGESITVTADCASKGAIDLVVKRIFVAEGERVEADSLLMITEFVKVVNEVRAPYACVIGHIHVALDDEVQVGDKLIDLRVAPA